SRWALSAGSSRADRNRFAGTPRSPHYSAPEPLRPTNRKQRRAKLLGQLTKLTDSTECARPRPQQALNWPDVQFLRKRFKRRVLLRPGTGALRGHARL